MSLYKLFRFDYLSENKINFYNESSNPRETYVGSFYRKGIPGITITAGQDKEPSCYHQPCDDMNGIDFEVMSNITKIVLYTPCISNFLFCVRKNLKIISYSCA